MNAKISSIQQDFRKDCSKCGASAETLIHALKDCPTARAILTLGGLDDFITTLWNSWNNRNNYVFCGKEEEGRVIWDRAKTLCQDFRIHNLVNKPVLPLTLTLKKWEKPPCGTVKINFDATVFNNKTGFGVIVHDSDGFILGGGGGFKYEDITAEWAKLYAFEEGLKIVCSLNITKAIFKIDCAILVNRVN
ncbi:hypothetical protein Gotri_015603 [Gossypium trilobum]|uniref:RNase H type-1 domain-containing protein n=1 Tax=Gossypium trilobum TaxID=34281 RepID=A0A7J9E0N0_9ROSI|nr:hypothetical protein [Gossypium trilobum]